MSAYVPPPTHTVVVRYADGRPYARYTSHDPAESQRYAKALMAANSNLVAEVLPVERDVPEGFRPFDEMEAAA